MISKGKKHLPTKAHFLPHLAVTPLTRFTITPLHPPTVAPLPRLTITAAALSYLRITFSPLNYHTLTSPNDHTFTPLNDHTLPPPNGHTLNPPSGHTLNPLNDHTFTPPTSAVVAHFIVEAVRLSTAGRMEAIVLVHAHQTVRVAFVASAQALWVAARVDIVRVPHVATVGTQHLVMTSAHRVWTLCV